jgi:hypothetical protein
MADCKTTPEQRFWAKVDRRGPDECWPWLAYLSVEGYGRHRFGGRVENAHRVAYRLAHGEIPAGLVVRHRCDNAACVNPAHLVLGTVQQNNADRLERGRYARGTVPPVERRPKLVRQTIRERLLSNIRIDEAGCWVWTRGKVRTGHGLITVGGASERVHRIAYEEFVGPIPNGLQILHSCDNASCINPDHLRPGTHRENMADMKERGRAAKGANNHFGKVKYEGEGNARSKLTAEAVMDIRTSGLSSLDLAAKHGVSFQAVQHARAGRTWKHLQFADLVAPPPRGCKGEKNGRAKFTAESVKSIRASPETCASLAAKHGVNMQTIWRIKAGISWPNVE